MRSSSGKLRFIMIKLIFTMLLLSTCWPVGGAQQNPPSAQQQPSVELPPELARVLSDYDAAWQNRNAAALAALFVEDGFVLPQGYPPVRGRGAIERYYTGQGGPLSLRAIAFAAEGGVGYIIGGYSVKKGEQDIGKFTLTLRKAPGGRWQIVSDMDNGSQQPRRQ
jgi:ketosteroid isomerase-like protein